MAPNKRARGRGSVYPEGNRWIGALPLFARPPSYVTGATEEEATAKLDAILDGYTSHHIHLPKKLGEDATAKATENDTTLSRVVESKLVEYVKEGEES
jgi:hypothetical protein